MRNRFIPLSAFTIVAGLCVAVAACSDDQYAGPGLATGGGGSGGNGTAGTQVVPTSGTTSVSGGGMMMTSGGNTMTSGTGGMATGGGGADGGGTGGMSSGGSMAGTGGAAMEQSPIPMDMLQHKWRYVHTCKYLNGQPISNFPTCSTGNNDICWETADGGRWFDPNPPVWHFAGDPNKTYAIKIRMRAISEPKTLKNCVEVNPRVDQTHPQVCDGTGQNVSNPGENFNILNLRFMDPRQDYYMNMAPIDEPHRVEKLDETWTIKAKGGSAVTFLFDDLNGGEIRNCPKYTFPGMPEVAPYDNTAIDGEFWQWDCADPKGGDACWSVVQ